MRWLELVFLSILLPGQGCHHDFAYCPVPAAVGSRAGCLDEDLCFCDPTTGVLPPPKCYLMMQAGRWHAIEPLEARDQQPIGIDLEDTLANAAPPAGNRPPKDEFALLPDFGPPPLKIDAEHPRSNPGAEGILAQRNPRRGNSRPVDEPAPPPAFQPAPLTINEEMRPAAVDAEPIVVKAVPRPRKVVPSKIVPSTVTRADEPVLPAAPRPAPITISAVIQPPAGDAADVLEEGTPRPAKAPPTADPALPPAPRPAPLQIGVGSAPLPRAEVPKSGLSESAEYRSGRDREAAGPLQDWEAS